MEGESYKPTSVGNWLVTLILISIPVLNIILCLVWAFSSNTPISKANFAKAALIWLVILFLFYVLVFGAALTGSY